ncbi:SusD/RagB family lipoprotein precursor [Tenacibaculum litoreum]|uniref:SusD/RagB family nutrient-binding outer membrane lipoprotein n=1 Tax=Tenacibaculum litoreum TaxID=321269 RepID=UPI00389312EC
MKKYIISAISLFLVFTSCEVDEGLNIDTKNPTTVPASGLFTNGTRNMFDLMNSTSVNNNVFRLYAQYFAQTTYPDESQYNQVTRDIGGSIWNTMYRDVLQDLKGAKELAAKEAEGDPVASQHLPAKLAQIDFIQVYAYSVLVDTFGNVPYTEALDTNNPTPVYDDAATIYTDLLTRLDNVISNINTGNGFEATQDPIYQGDMSKWLKAAVSLKLRLAMRLADSNPTLSQQKAEEAASASLILTNADNFGIKYLSAAPNTNPLWTDLVQSGRTDYIAANTLVDAMNPIKDPRRYGYYAEDMTYVLGTVASVIPPVSPSTTTQIIFDSNLANTPVDMDSKVYMEDTFIGVVSSSTSNSISIDNISSTPSVGDVLHFSKFLGGTYGSANSPTGGSAISDLMKTPDLPGNILTAAEVNFLLAEAAARNYTVSNTIEDYYNEGITQSILEWQGSATDATTYLAQPSVAYSTAAGDWKQKIATQKWIAMYNNGFEGWTTWRIFDAPTLNAPTGMSLSDIPTRFTYPVVQAQLNNENNAAAGAAIGGNFKTTKLFWDLN